MSEVVSLLGEAFTKPYSVCKSIDTTATTKRGLASEEDRFKWWHVFLIIPAIVIQIVRIFVQKPAMPKVDKEDAGRD